MSKLQVKIDGEWQDLVKIEEVDYKNFEWGKDKTYVKEPLRSGGEVKGTINAKFEEIFKPKCFVANLSEVRYDRRKKTSDRSS